MKADRRLVCQSLGGLLATWGMTAHSQSASSPEVSTLNEEKQMRERKFRGVVGADWSLSTLADLSYIHIYDEDGRIIDAPYGISGQGGGRFFIGQVPIRLRVTWREKDAQNPIINRGRGPRNSTYWEAWTGGRITGSYEIPVAERIPDELLDDLRRDPRGTLRIKVRLHRDGVLLGWDIERRPNPWGFTRDQIAKDNRHIAPAWSHTGGDFKEARRAYYTWEGDQLGSWPTPVPPWTPGTPLDQAPWSWKGFIKMPSAGLLRAPLPEEWTRKGLYIESGSGPGSYKHLREKGWHIHPKTGQRIETDF